MFVAVRRISPYDGSDVVLGAFRFEQAATEYLSAYRRRCIESPENDPWAQQTYVTDPYNDEHFVVVEVDHGELDESVLYLVSTYSEGFGQTLRSFDSWQPSRAAAARRCRQIKPPNQFAFYCLFQEIPIDTPLPDGRQDQPNFNDPAFWRDED